MFVAIVILFAYTAIASSIPNIDSTNYKEHLSFGNYIVGGQPARPGQFPFLASLRRANNQHFCGGAILSNRWCLSAAHCFLDATREPRNVHVWVGAHGRQDGFRHLVQRIVNHPQFNQQFMMNDISVIQTTTVIQFIQGRVQPIRLPSADYTDAQHHRVWVAGWGLTGYPNVGDRYLPPHLIFKQAITIGRADCRQRLGRRALLMQENKLCTLTGDGQGTCRGDAGGPLVTDQGVCVGIISWSVPCATAYPDVYSRTFPHLRFIFQTTGLRPQ